MSDAQKTINYLDLQNISEYQKVRSVISDSFFATYGFAISDSDGVTVDVQLIVQDVMASGIEAPQVVLDPIVCQKVELLFPCASGMVQSWTIKKGDGILILGLRDWIPKVAGVTKSAAPAEFWHYSLQTLKAIPLAPKRSDSAVQFGEKDGKAFLRNTAKSLYTLLDTVEAALAQFTGTTAQSSITSAGAGLPQTVALAAAIVALMVTFTSATATMRSDLAALLEA